MAPMWWLAMLDQIGQISKAKGLLIKATSMTCLFPKVAGHMCNIMLALASQVSKASSLLTKASNATCHALKVLGKFLFLNCMLVPMSKTFAQRTLCGGRLCMFKSAK